jgi:hypothetical protein
MQQPKAAAAPSFDPFSAPAPPTGSHAMVPQYPQQSQQQMGMHGFQSAPLQFSAGGVSAQTRPMSGTIGGGSAPSTQGGDFGDFEAAKPVTTTKAPVSSADWSSLVNLSDIKLKADEPKPKGPGASSSAHDHSMSFQGLDGFSKQQPTSGYVSGFVALSNHLIYNY